MNPNDPRSELKEALLAQKGFFKCALFFAFFTNLFVMAPTYYMLEVYDRVVNSRSVLTLAMLTLLVVGVYLLMEILEWVRAEILQHASVSFDKRMGARLFNTMFEANLRRIPGATSQVMMDFRTVRDFISSPAILAMMDIPLSLLYIIVVFLINPVMGYFSLAGAVIQIAIAYMNERSTQPPLTAANRSAIDAQNYASNALRNTQVIEAMGMLSNIHARWLTKQRDLLIRQGKASDIAGGYAAAAKFMQLAQSSLLLGLGCWLTILGQFPGGGGMMLVASILGGRILAPISQVIGMWKNVVNARDAYDRLNNLSNKIPEKQPGMQLPAPKGMLTVENVFANAPGSPIAILSSITFGVPAGSILGIVGPSASGKSTLARLLVGVWPAASGKVRLDGVDIFPWNKSELGPHIGYLPQDTELFDGTLAENIARFGEVEMSKVEAAAKAVGLHEYILALPNGYESEIGEEGCFLSGGQRQRLGLARAFYGNPKFVVLDEPNSSLDEAGEQALLNTLIQMKAKGTTTILITHRTNVLPAVDGMLVLVGGQIKALGPRDEVLAALRKGAEAAAQPTSPAAHAKTYAAPCAA